MEQRPRNLLRRFAAAFFLWTLAGCASSPTVAWKVPDDVRTIAVNGYPVAYKETGSGSTVILVHGAMCDYRCWGTTQGALAGKHRVISVSMRHFYPEVWDGTGNTFTVAQHAKDLVAFIEKMSPPVRLVGHSYGGLVASEAARARPDLVAKLVLAEGATDQLLGAPSEEQLKSRGRFAEHTGNLLKTRGPEAGLEFAVDTLNGKGAWSRYPVLVQTFHRDNAWTVVGAARDGSTRSTCSELGALKMPILLVTGQNTSPRYKQILAAQGKCMPSARTVVIPNAGHAMMMNRTAFEPALVDFLR